MDDSLYLRGMIRGSLFISKKRETLQKPTDANWSDHERDSRADRSVSGKIVVTHHRYCWLGSYDERDMVCHHEKMPQ